MKANESSESQLQDIRRIVKALASQVNVDEIDVFLKEKKKILKINEKASLKSLGDQVNMVICYIYLIFVLVPENKCDHFVIS